MRLSLDYASNPLKFKSNEDADQIQSLRMAQLYKAVRLRTIVTKVNGTPTQGTVESSKGVLEKNGGERITGLHFM